jgi:DNA-binding transcriptional regulator LsrR (DeoR family)
MNAPTKEKLMDLRFTEKMKREDIAELYGVSIATVRRWIKEMNIPRPARTKIKRNKRLTPSGEIVIPLVWRDEYTSLEMAQMRLEGRLITRASYGYYLCGRLTDIDTILVASESLADVNTVTESSLDLTGQ